jgi:NADH-quinone oxidoreductase subunit F
MRTAESAWPIKELIKHFCPRMERRIADAKGDEMLEAAE